MPRARAGTVPPDQFPAVQIDLLGGFAVVIDGQPLPERAWGGSRKSRALVKLLALAPGQRLHRDQALDALWPDLDPDAGGRALHQALYLVRRALAPAQVQAALQGQVIALHTPGGLTTDLATFQAAAAHARRSRDHADYRAALALYAGDLLPDDRYEEWAVQPREAARATYLGLLRDLAAAQEAGGDAAGAVATFERLVEAEQADEAAHVALMRLHAQGGRRAQALRQFGLLRATLQRDLDAEPEATSQQLYAAILAGQFLEVGGQKPKVGNEEGAKARHNLPAPTTALIGRAEAIDAIRRELAGARLVTLLGTGGIGKTRLALAIGHALLADYPGGVWLLDLAALQDGALLIGTLAGVLSVRERAGQPLRETIIAALHDRPALIVLDNCEHLVGACADLATALLAGCPDLRLLATSREALRVAGELTWRVPSLHVPDLASGAAAVAPSGLTENPAARLFLDRARFARPGFVLTEENAAAVATICRRLDGIPLALELAAARIAVLAPQQLADRLDDALRLLTGGPRTALPRHQTLRATLEWSYQFLVTPERALLDRLAVFAGGCTLAVAEAVCDLGDETLDLLAALVDKSLVQVELGAGEEEPRYRLLETVRQFAAERLAAAGQEQTYRARHAAEFLRLAEEAEPGLLSEHQSLWLARFTREIDNLRAALVWYATHDRVGGQLRLASALDRFWMSGNYYQEGLTWLTDGLEQAREGIATAIRARAYHSVALLLVIRSDISAADYATTSLSLHRDLGDRDKQASACNVLGIVARLQGNPERSRPYLEEALTLWRAAGNARGVATVSINLAAEYIDRDEMATAVAIYEDALPLVRAQDDRRLLHVILGNLGLGYTSLERFVEARAAFAEAIRLMAVLQDWSALALGLSLVALGATGQGDHARGAQLLGASAKIRTITNLVLPPAQQRFADRAASAASTSLGEAAFATAHATGFAWSIEEGIAQTLAFLTD